jgi:Zn-dependent protease
MYTSKPSFRNNKTSSDEAYSSFNYFKGRKPNSSRVFRFSDRELKHLGISLLLIMIMPFTIFRYIYLNLQILFFTMIIFATAFLFHELAHKFSAQRLGYLAEFRLNMFGLLITLTSFISPFKIVAPGAVVILGLMNTKDYGKISISGPLSNIFQAIIYLGIALLSSNPMIETLARLGMTINSSLSLFNLIPFGLFDGRKIMKWNRTIWLITVIISGSLFFFSSAAYL